VPQNVVFGHYHLSYSFQAGVEPIQSFPLVLRWMPVQSIELVWCCASRSHAFFSQNGAEIRPLPQNEVLGLYFRYFVSRPGSSIFNLSVRSYGSYLESGVIERTEFGRGGEKWHFPFPRWRRRPILARKYSIWPLNCAMQRPGRSQAYPIINLGPWGVGGIVGRTDLTQ